MTRNWPRTVACTFHWITQGLIIWFVIWFRHLDANVGTSPLSNGAFVVMWIILAAVFGPTSYLLGFGIGKLVQKRSDAVRVNNGSGR